MTGTIDQTDRVRANTSPETLQRIDHSIEEKIRFYARQPHEVISRRIGELEREWDIERFLETNASSLALAGLILGLTKSRGYLLLTGGVLSFLLMHGIQGWCPPLPILRGLGIRTRSEIDREKFALKILRGDFQGLGQTPASLQDDPAGEVIRVVSRN